MAVHHQLWKLAAHFNNLVLKTKNQYAFDHKDLYGNISFGISFLEPLSRTKGIFLGQHVWGVILTVHLENFISHLLFFSCESFFTKPVFIPSGLTKGNQVSTGHYQETFQSSANESASKY